MKTKIFFGVALFNLLFYLAMESIWSGIQGMFGLWWLQYLFLGLIVLIFLILVVMLAKKYIGKTVWVFGGISLAFTVALFYMFYLGIGSLRYILRSFAINVLIFGVVLFVLYLLLEFPKTKIWKTRFFRITFLLVLMVFLLGGSFLANFVMIRNMPTVFAVEDEYQIVWVTSIKATGQVRVGETYYKDTYAGSLDSETVVHKVSVPMAVLDAAKEYEIISTNMIYRGPYSGLAGRTIKKTFAFRPVNLEDGLQFYTLSDTHEYVVAGSKTGSYYGDDLDFLVLAGDISSFLDTISDISIIHKIAYNITKGERPVVYARGNHEVKGLKANELYKYVGSKNQKFYYTFNLGGVFGIVLDLGEDHPDDWWEYYETANFTDYRNEQTFFLEAVLASGAFLDPAVKFRLGICHMPIVNVYNHDSNYDENNLYLDEIKNEWTASLNGMNLDLMVSGHRHQLLQFLEDTPKQTTLYYHDNYSASNIRVGYMTNANFPTFLVSRRSDVQTPAVKENLFGQKIIGLATTVDFDTGKMDLYYTNSQQQTVTIIDPFLGDSVERFEIPLGGW
ncbi:MAG: metallophosphoesterase family protein [Candidatus Izemoplasmatales bacterium]|jgi:UDP-2,3-diacylglucosamine pyrophosphatase LpxH